VSSNSVESPGVGGGSSGKVEGVGSTGGLDVPSGGVEALSADEVSGEGGLSDGVGDGSGS
jgi:hypothetical protein